MAFVVQDDTGLSTANSHTSVAEFKAYCLDRGIDITSFTDDTAIENALVKGCDYQKATYYGNWIGELVLITQSTPFPRLVDGVNIGIPTDVKYSQITLALEVNKSTKGELTLNAGQKAIKKKVEGLQIEYDKYSDEMVHYTKSNDLLRPYLLNSNSNSYKAVR